MLNISPAFDVIWQDEELITKNLQLANETGEVYDNTSYRFV